MSTLIALNEFPFLGPMVHPEFRNEAEIVNYPTSMEYPAGSFSVPRWLSSVVKIRELTK